MPDTKCEIRAIIHIYAMIRDRITLFDSKIERIMATYYLYGTKQSKK